MDGVGGVVGVQDGEGVEGSMYVCVCMYGEWINGWMHSERLCHTVRGILNQHIHSL